MIFAELQCQADYRVVHDELVVLVSANFPDVKSGLQGDSWIWIHESGETVEIDTFTAMTHQIKSTKPGPLLQKVLDLLRQKYKVRVFDAPERESHEDD